MRIFAWLRLSNAPRHWHEYVNCILCLDPSLAVSQLVENSVYICSLSATALCQVVLVKCRKTAPLDHTTHYASLFKSLMNCVFRDFSDLCCQWYVFFHRINTVDVKAWFSVWALSCLSFFFFILSHYHLNRNPKIFLQFLFVLWIGCSEALVWKRS